MREVDLTGRFFGKIEVLRKVAHMRWECKCPYCEKTFTLWYQALTKPGERERQSCGCRNKHNQTYVEYAASVAWKNCKYDDGDISLEQFMELAKLNCHYCNRPPANCYDVGKKLQFTPDKETTYTYSGLDRLDSSRTHTLDNVVPCCKECNLAKKNKTKSEFLAQVAKIVQHLGLVAKKE